MPMPVIDSLMLDVSTYDFGTFDPECFWNAGVRRLIIGTYPQAHAKDMARQWRGHDPKAEIFGFYGLSYFGDVFYEWRDINWAIQACKEFGVKRVMIDCEQDAHELHSSYEPTTVAHRQDVVRQLVAAVRAAGLEPWIYTYRHWWMTKMGNTTEWKNLPLWYAAYGSGGGPISPIWALGDRAFGGWGHAKVHQYTSNMLLCGRVRDHNYLFQGYNEVDIDMTPAEVEAIWDRKQRELELRAGAGYVSFVKLVTNRFDAIHDTTISTMRLADQLKGIHEATDLKKYPPTATP